MKTENNDARAALEHLNQMASKGDNEKYDANKNTLISIERELDSAIGMVADQIADEHYNTELDRIKAIDAIRAASAVQNDLLDLLEY